MIHTLRLPRWNDVLLELYKSQQRQNYCEKLNRRVKTSRSHIQAIVKLLEKNGLITITPGKKLKKLSLTERGKDVATAIQQLRSELG
jgi:predicted transcriptional regulator